jgi:CheY-like chemotaxis protein
MVEDNPGDVRLTREALKKNKIRNQMDVASDGFEAMEYLERRGRHAEADRPDLILLDLNLPKKNGHEVLQAIKSRDELKRIPVVVLTSSSSEVDILKSYDLNANCFVTKPVDLNQFITVVQNIRDFWVEIVTLPTDEE